MRVEQSLMALERYMNRCWREQSEGSDCSLTYAEYDYLETLNESGSMRLSDLAELMRVSKPTTSNMVGRLELKKLLIRQPCPEDGRAVKVALSKKGQELLNNDRVFYGQIIAGLLDGLSLQDQRHVEDLLARMVAKTIKR